MSLKMNISALVLTILGAAPIGAQAAINMFDSPELVLVLWDPVAQASYTRDLGIAAYSGDSGLRPDTFFVRAQQDSGYQQFWSLDGASDANYAQFRRTVVDTSNMLWAVIGVGFQSGDLSPGNINIFSTLRPTDNAGQVGAAYRNVVDPSVWNGSEFGTAAGQAQDYIVTLNGAKIDASSGTRNPWNSHVNGLATADFDVNGSSFDVVGQAGYYAAVSTPTWGAGCNCMNAVPVGQSSWFYRMSNWGDDSFNFDPINLDEFDNLSHDGYWGVAVNPADGKLVLSYTLAPATLASLGTTEKGKAASLLRDYSAGGNIHQIAGPVGEFAGYTAPMALAPVPEPAGAALSLAGLAALGLRARRHKRMG
jgi:hypothetical protein